MSFPPRVQPSNVVLIRFRRRDDKSSRYVAEENIEITEAEPSAALMGLAGRYFKRWDRESGRFVSNITEEYPDN